MDNLELADPVQFFLICTNHHPDGINTILDLIFFNTGLLSRVRKKEEKKKISHFKTFLIVS